MDIPRRISHWPRRLKATAALLAVALLLAWGWSWASDRLGTVEVDAGQLVIGTVVRTELVRDVRAAGVLVPQELRWIAAGVDGRVENILVEAGTQVMPDTVILELSNPTVARDADTARIELDVLRAERSVQEQRQLNERLAQQAVVAEYAARFESAHYRMKANQELGAAVARVDLNESTLLTRQYEERLAFEKERLARLDALQEAELVATAANIARAQRQLDLAHELLAGLKVRAGLEGTLQEVPVEMGQLIATGTPLARVARDDRFKTELRVQEGQARELSIGQRVRISAGGQHSAGVVSRIDPAVQEGTVLVDVRFVEEAMPGARPDLRVQGVIEIDRVADTLVLQRPVYTQENSTTGLFVVAPDGASAQRTAVELGLGSVDRIEVLGGLAEGDRVIVSDMNRFEGIARVEMTGVRP